MQEPSHRPHSRCVLAGGCWSLMEFAIYSTVQCFQLQTFPTPPTACLSPDCLPLLLGRPVFSVPCDAAGMTLRMCYQEGYQAVSGTCCCSEMHSLPPPRLLLPFSFHLACWPTASASGAHKLLEKQKIIHRMHSGEQLVSSIAHWHPDCLLSFASFVFVSHSLFRCCRLLDLGMLRAHKSL